MSRGNSLTSSIAVQSSLSMVLFGGRTMAPWVNVAWSVRSYSKVSTVSQFLENIAVLGRHHQSY